MTPPDTWTPLPETVDYIEESPASVAIGEHIGGSHEHRRMNAVAGVKSPPPNRLAFCRGVLVRAGREIDDG